MDNSGTHGDVNEKTPDEGILNWGINFLKEGYVSTGEKVKQVLSLSSIFQSETPDAGGMGKRKKSDHKGVLIEETSKFESRTNGLSDWTSRYTHTSKILPDAWQGLPEVRWRQVRETATGALLDSREIHDKNINKKLDLGKTYS